MTDTSHSTLSLASLLNNIEHDEIDKVRDFFSKCPKESLKKILTKFQHSVFSIVFECINNSSVNCVKYLSTFSEINFDAPIIFNIRCREKKDNDIRYYPLHFAVISKNTNANSINVLKYIIERLKVDVNVTSHLGYTPIESTHNKAHIDVLASYPQTIINIKKNNRHLIPYKIQRLYRLMYMLC